MAEQASVLTSYFIEKGADEQLQERDYCHGLK